MSAPATSDMREIERLLMVAAETGQNLTVTALMGEVPGVDVAGITATLQALREVGKAFEDAPGEWRGPYEDEIAAVAAGEPEPIVVSVPAPETPDEGPPDWFGQSDNRRRPQVSAGPTVKLTPAIAAALSAESLGAVVKAGIDEADKAGIPFILEVS